MPHSKIPVLFMEEKRAQLVYSGTMKRSSVFLLLAPAILFTLPLVASSIEIGDTKNEVLRELGEPTAFSDLGTKALMMYPRGKVVLVDGKVSSTTILSDEAYQKKQAAALAMRQKRAGALEAERKARIQEGQTMLADLKTNEAYLASSALRKVEILESFQKRYPETNIDELLVPARLAARDAMQAQGTQLADDMRRDPAYSQKPWEDRFRILREFTARYPKVDIDDLKVDVIADRNRGIVENQQRAEMARLRRDAAQSDALRLEEMRRREMAEQALARAERQNAYNRYRPYPVYVPVPVPVSGSVVQPQAPAQPAVYQKESFLERSRREADKITRPKF